ncbi:MAG: serine hydrolase, partial [Alphaproteobacteria bacterium]|nr:serine hydrolase [Alphaproteobacteria bacterium]
MPRYAISLVLAAVSLGACDGIDRATAVATGYVSHQLCSATFVSQLDPEPFYRQAVAPILSPVSLLESHQVDRQKAEVRSRFAGLSTTHAVFRGPLGCLVLHGEPPAPVVLPPDTSAPALQPEIAGPAIVEPDQPALKQALDRAFAENAQPPYRNTKAVVVVRDGRVIAERYAPGYGIDTQLVGWSMTKSITNALIGILVRQ